MNNSMRTNWRVIGGLRGEPITYTRGAHSVKIKGLWLHWCCIGRAGSLIRQKRAERLKGRSALRGWRGALGVAW